MRMAPHDSRDPGPENQARRELHDIADLAAAKAARSVTHETFRLLGVDIDNQDSLNSFRSDLVYANRLRKTSERAQLAALGIIVSVVVGAALAALWTGIKQKMGWHP